MGSCGLLFSWMSCLISESSLPAGYSRQCYCYTDQCCCDLCWWITCVVLNKSEAGDAALSLDLISKPYLFSHGKLRTQQTSFSGKGVNIYICFENCVRLPTWRDHWKRSPTQTSHPIDCNCTCTCTGVGAHTGWPSGCSAEERYNNINNRICTLMDNLKSVDPHQSSLFVCCCFLLYLPPDFCFLTLSSSCFMQRNRCSNHKAMNTLSVRFVSRSLLLCMYCYPRVQFF